MTLALKMYELREKAGVTTSDAAWAIGVSETAIRLWDKGEVAPNLKYLPAIVQIYKCTPEDVLTAFYGREWQEQARSEEVVEDA